MLSNARPLEPFRAMTKAVSPRETWPYGALSPWEKVNSVRHSIGQGGIVLLPPLAGEGGDGGETLGRSAPLRRTPTPPSPVEGEGSGSQVPHMTYLPLSGPFPEGRGRRGQGHTMWHATYLPLSAHQGGGNVGREKLGKSGRSAKFRPHCSARAWGWWLAVACLALMSLTSCRATMGRVIGQQFVSSAYAFEIPLPGDEWQPVPDEPSVLTLTHSQLAAGITISVTCDWERDVPLDILTRHLFFGFKNMEVLHQEPQAINGVPALETVARARLDAREVQVHSYVVRRDGCVYDMVYFASPQDYSRGEPSFARMMAGFRFLQR
jgi:hypothetical protein